MSLTKMFLTSLLLAFSVSTLACLADGDITSPGFTIDLAAMDPIHTGGSSTPSGQGAMNYILNQIANLLLIVVPIIAGVSFMVAGYFFILSGGDSEKASKAKTIIKWNLIAIVVAFLSYSIINILHYLIS